MHPPESPLVPMIDLPSGIRTVAIPIHFLVLSPCSAMGKLRMILATMETPTPSALALYVGYGKQPLGLTAYFLSGVLQANEYCNQTQDYLSQRWTSRCTIPSHTPNIPN